MLLSINNLTKSFGEKTILKDVSLTIGEGDRIGLIGINGAGKSTLAGIICGQTDFEQGEVSRSSSVSIGFLQQNSGLDKNNTILEEMCSVYSDVINMEKRLGELEKIISHRDCIHDVNYTQAAREYSLLQETFEKNDGYTFHVNIKIVLNGMGFSDKDHNMNISLLSGGEKTRLALAKLLLEKPDLLVLDEPTNHLDFNTLAWLENYLSGYKGAILVVSHDRYFLDKMVSKIWEIENTKAVEYKGNYTKYKVLKEQRVQYQLKQYEAQQVQLAAMQQFADRNIARASTANSAKSRIHAIERMELIEKPITRNKAAKLEFSFDKQSVKDVLTVSNLEISVGESTNKVILSDNINFELKRGQKVAIVGANGIGKSTLLKLILGLAPLSKGDVVWGKHVSVSYFDQENLNLNPNKTALEQLWSKFPQQTESSVRANLGRVLLTGDNVFKKVSVLSGGERAKLAFAIIFMEHRNTLILDEPTNHLDIAAKEILEQGLKSFDGTILFVSHDRYLLNQLPTKIIELGSNRITVYDGNFDYYIQKKQSIQNTSNSGSHSDNVAAGPKQTVNKKQQRSQIAKRRTDIAKLEQLINGHEQRIEQLNEEIAAPENASDYLLLEEKCTQLQCIKSELDQFMQQWIELMDE